MFSTTNHANPSQNHKETSPRAMQMTALQARDKCFVCADAKRRQIFTLQANIKVVQPLWKTQELGVVSHKLKINLLHHLAISLMDIWPNGNDVQEASATSILTVAQFSIAKHKQASAHQLMSSLKTCHISMVDYYSVMKSMKHCQYDSKNRGRSCSVK